VWRRKISSHSHPNSHCFFFLPRTVFRRRRRLCASEFKSSSL
jgi:hypothetical protein